jgi:hypothetical protein
MTETIPENGYELSVSRCIAAAPEKVWQSNNDRYTKPYHCARSRQSG